MSKADKFFNYSWVTLLVVLLLCVSTIFNGIVYMIFIYPIMENMCLKSVTEEECIEHREKIYKKVSEIAKEHGYKTQEVHIAEGLDKLIIDIDTMSRIEYMISTSNNMECMYLKYILDDVKYNDKDKKINIDFLVEVTNLVSAVKLTEEDINELSLENNEKRIPFLPFVIEELFCQMNFNYYKNDSNYKTSSRMILKITATTVSCLNL